MGQERIVSMSEHLTREFEAPRAMWSVWREESLVEEVGRQLGPVHLAHLAVLLQLWLPTCLYHWMS